MGVPVLIARVQSPIPCQSFLRNMPASWDPVFLEITTVLRYIPSRFVPLYG